MEKPYQLAEKQHWLYSFHCTDANLERLNTSGDLYLNLGDEKKQFFEKYAVPALFFFF